MWGEVVNFDAGTWWLVSLAVGAVMTVIGYFLKRTMSKVDEHDKDINVIKQTYVTKDEMKELRAEIKADLDKISSDMDEMKEKNLSKQDFYRSQGEMQESIKQIMNLLIKKWGDVV